jgi:hypothetical protein
MSDLGRALRFLLRNPTNTEPAAEKSEDPHEIRGGLFREIGLQALRRRTAALIRQP